jgi:hypothetical protein
MMERVDNFNEHVKKFKEIKKYAVKVSDYNTNNGWGFGGAYGKQYTFADGSTVMYGWRCYRHADPDRIIIAKDKDGDKTSVFDINTDIKTFWV